MKNEVNCNEENLNKAVITLQTSALWGDTNMWTKTLKKGVLHKMCPFKLCPLFMTSGQHLNCSSNNYFSFDWTKQTMSHWYCDCSCVRLTFSLLHVYKWHSLQWVPFIFISEHLMIQEKMADSPGLTDLCPRCTLVSHLCQKRPEEWKYCPPSLGAQKTNNLALLLYWPFLLSNPTKLIFD